MFFSFVYLLLSTYKKLLSVRNSVVRLLGAQFTLEEAFIITDLSGTGFISNYRFL